MKFAYLLLLGVIGTNAHKDNVRSAQNSNGDCQGHYIEDGRFSLCIGDSDCTHPNNFCSEGKCNKFTKTCVAENEPMEDTRDAGDKFFSELIFGKKDDIEDQDVWSFMFGDWGVLKLTDNNGTELYSNFDDRIGNVTKALIFSIPEKLIGFDIMKWFDDLDENKVVDVWPKEQTTDTPFYKMGQHHKEQKYEGFKGDGVPTAMFHGFGDMCLNPGIKNIDKIISDGTGAPAHCIETGLPSLGEVFANFESVAKKACEKVAAHPDFQGEFNVIGLSQGGLLARYIVEECDMPGKVRNMLTIGGPHMGVDAVPHCYKGIFCDVINFFIKKLVYIPIAQNLVSPAGYFRDVNNFAAYQRNSVFLPALNNEEVHSGEIAKIRKERFSNLNALMLIKFEQDTMIYPRETAWFQQLDKHNTVIPLNQTDFYNNDVIGLKTLTEAGKVDYHSLPGDHLTFTIDDVKNTMIPFLNK